MATTRPYQPFKSNEKSDPSIDESSSVVDSSISENDLLNVSKSNDINFKKPSINGNNSSIHSAASNVAAANLSPRPRPLPGREAILRGQTGYVPTQTKFSKIDRSMTEPSLPENSQRSAFSTNTSIDDSTKPMLRRSGSACFDNGEDGSEEKESSSGASCLWFGSQLLSCIFSEASKDDSEVVLPRSHPLHLGAKLQAVSRLLSANSADILYDMLPETERMAMPVLAFATYRDGWSMENFIEKTKDKEPVLLLIRSLKNSYVIGAFSTSRLSPPSKAVRGDGECFVFRLSGPQPAKAYKWFHNPARKKAGQSQTSEQFLVATREYIAFGASHEHGTNALRLDGDLLTCSSGPSDTYHSASLTPGDDGPFQVRDIEVIQLGDRRARRRTRSAGR